MIKMKEVRLDLFRLHDENDKGKGRIKVVLDRKFYRNCLKQIRDNLGMKNREIATKIDMTYFDFMKNLQNDKLPIVSLEKLIELYCKATRKPKQSVNQIFLDKIRKIVCNSGKAFLSTNYVSCLSENLCRIAGAIITDGSLHIDKDKNGYGYTISLSDYYEDNIRLFCTWIHDVFGINIGYKHHKDKNYFETRFKNKIVFRYLNKILGIPHGKKSKIVKMPEIIKNSKIEHRNAFVSGALIFDGGVVFKSGYYQFASQSLSLLKDIENVLVEFNIKPDYRDNLPDKMMVYRLVIRDREKLKRLLKYFIPPNSPKYLQLNLHIEGFGKLNTLDKVIEKLDKIYPRFGKSLLFSDIIRLVSDGKPFVVKDLVKQLGKSQDIIKKSLNKLENWKVLSSNNSKGKVNKVWNINPNLKLIKGG